MTGKLRPTVLAAIIACTLLGGASAHAAPDGTPLGGKSFVTQHKGTFNGKAIDYSAIVSEIVLKKDDGAPSATVSSIAYIAKSEGEPARPVIFIWNGGPSVASTTLHMAGFGPKRLVTPTDVNSPIAPPYRVEDNTHSVLDVADLVFVDPVSTGFSRILAAGDRKFFYSAPGDAESIADFIQEWLKANHREASKRYILGTSYGSVRAALVAGVMAQSPMPLDGVILFSQGANLVETTQRKNSLIGYASNMPQLAAIAWFHGRTKRQGKSVYDLIDEAYEFSMGEYLTAIVKGSDLTDKKRKRVAERMSALTGISVDYYLDHNLLVSKGDFRRELLKDKGLILAATDSRYAYPADAKSPPRLPTAGVEEVFKQHLADFLSVPLAFDDYRAAAPGAVDWDYAGSSTITGQPAPPGAARSVFSDFDWPGEIAKAFEARDTFRLMIATGIYDTLTTSGPARLLASDVDFPAARVQFHEYEEGHAFYSNDAEFPRLADDVRGFVAPHSTSR